LKTGKAVTELAERNRQTMNKKYIQQLAKSFAVIPILASTLTANPLQIINDRVVTMSIQASDQQFLRALDEQAKARKDKADQIDAYFSEYDMPLEGYGMKMVIEAEKNNIDWRLIPAISVRESTGGKHACKKVKNSPFGWGSCKIPFTSMDEAIEKLALNLGGNNPNTAYHYDNKTTEEILKAYNPPSIVPKYTKQVLAIMSDISNDDSIAIKNS
jgi:hypothetical protein